MPRCSSRRWRCARSSSASARSSAWGCSRRRPRTSRGGSARATPLAAALALIAVFGLARSFTPGIVLLLLLLTVPVGVGMGLTGVYAAGINVGATVSAVLTRGDEEHVAASAPRPLALPWRSPLAWRLGGAFFFMSATYATQIVAGLSIAWLDDRMWSRRA